jgi:hypothetical protein
MKSPCGQLTFPAAEVIALIMFWYPVQRQVLPAMALRISFSLGFEFIDSS